MQTEKATADKMYTQWREVFPELEALKARLEDSYRDLQEYRQRHDKIQAANDNAFDIDVGDADKNPNVIRSSSVKEGVDIFTSGMKFPEWDIRPIVVNGAESRTMASLAKAVIDWMIIESGFEEIYDDSKEPMVLHGDVYRGPFKKKLGKGVWMPQYEESDGYNVLLDTNSTELWSKTISKSSAMLGKVKILSEEQVIMRFTKDVLPFIEPGAVIDLDEYTKKTGNDTGGSQKYYELIEVSNIADEVEYVLLGKNWFLPHVAGGIGKKERPKEMKKYNSSWKKDYPHRDELKRAFINTHNMAMYVNRKKIRNNGLGERVYRLQVADEALQNTGFNASRIRGVQIPYITGISTSIAQDRVEEWKERRASDVLAFLDVSGMGSSNKPDIGVLKFDGVRAEEMRASVSDLYSAYRNYVGISFTRLEVRTGEGLGQSKLIEAEKVRVVEDVVAKQMGKLNHEIKCLFLYFINNRGFGLKDTLLEYCDVEEDVKSVTGESMGDIDNPHATISCVEAAKKLKDFMFSIQINMDTIVDRNNLAILEDLTKITGLVDGAVMPDEKKELLRQIFKIARIRIPENDFAGIEQESAQGGMGQFQGGGAPEGPAMPPQAPTMPPMQ